MGIINSLRHLPGRTYARINAVLDHFYSDKFLMNKTFCRTFGRKIDFNNPQTINEKIQWLKMNDRKPIYTQYVDKVLVKDFFEKNFGKEYVIPTLGVWGNADEIDFDSLPDQFVIKCNHNSGLGLYICMDKSSMNKAEVVRNLNKGLKEDYYIHKREWPYKNVNRKIIAEQLLLTSDNKVPNDYKLHFINGKLEFVYVSFDRFGINDRCTFDKDWNRLPFVWIPASSFRAGINTADVPKPESFELMKEFGSKIAKDIPYVRVDFFDVDGHLFFGEITLYHGSGYDKFFPDSYDEYYGNKLIIK